MCLIAFALHTHRRYPLVLVANRDEFHARPSAAAAFHDDDANIYGGRDLLAGGSWLLASKHGQVAAVTNVRTGATESGRRSRGELVRRAVASTTPVAELQQIHRESLAFGRFNLLAFDRHRLCYAGNHPAAHLQEIDAGLHTLSNAALDTPWPKTQRLRSVLAQWIARGDDEPTALFDALADTRAAADVDLPDTGVPLEWERRLSAAFIVGSDYGTRASSVVLVADDHILFVERSFGPGGVMLGEIEQRIMLQV